LDGFRDKLKEINDKYDAEQKKLYDKYDKLIRPLLEAKKKTTKSIIPDENGCSGSKCLL
jgi:hypothetical protein